MTIVGVDFTHNYNYGGIGTYTRELVREMSLLHPEVHFWLVTQFNKSIRFKELYAGIENIDIKEMMPSNLFLGKGLKNAADLVRRCIWQQVSQKIDLIHFTYPDYYVSGLNNSISTIHDIIPLYISKYKDIDRQKLGKYRIDKIIRESRRVIVPSKFVKGELEKYFPLSIGKTFVIYEGIKDLFKCCSVDYEVLRKYAIPKGMPFYLYVSRLEQRKNLDYILEAFRMLPNSYRKEVSLVVIGNGNERLVVALRNKILELGIERSVYHLQGVPDVDLLHFYNAATALVFVSYSEGFGLPLVEAMNCGCPSIISNVSSLPEVADGAALLVDPYNVEQISHGMERMIDDSNLREKLKNKGLMVAKRYTWSKAASETIALYQQALA
ncbi:MAG: glycosyltransferase family 4 protein [Chlorobiaceae bacterium]|nr:glycosyltransferase family 4 protein [Chlorobiaceae bacterium]